MGRDCPCPVAGRSLRPSMASPRSEITSLSPSGLRSFSRPAPGARATPTRHSVFEVPEACRTPRSAACSGRKPAQRAVSVRRSTSGTQRAQARAACSLRLAFHLRHAAGASPRCVQSPFGVPPQARSGRKPALRAIRAAPPRRPCAQTGSQHRTGRTTSAARKAAGRAEARQARRGQGWPAGRCASQ